MRTKQIPTVPNYDDPNGVKVKLIKDIIAFLQMFIPPIMAKRIASALLLVAGVPHDRVSEWTGSCDRSVREWNKQISSGKTEKILMIGRGAGRKSKFIDIEDQVLEEIENGNYHTQQQIVDMVKEKFDVNVSLMAVSRLLKKRHQKAEVRFFASKGEAR